MKTSKRGLKAKEENLKAAEKHLEAAIAAHQPAPADRVRRNGRKRR